jgi:predicted metal-dependent phosphotriesterase family hydrolase
VTLVEGDIIADNTGFPNNHSHAVIDEKPASNLRSRMNLNAGEKARHLRESSRQQAVSAVQKPVTQPVGPKRVQAGITNYHLHA